MANYCSGCGAPVSGRFCAGCGRQVQADQAPPQEYQQQAPIQPAQYIPVAGSPYGSGAPAAPVKSGGGIGKFLLIGGGIVVVFVVLGVAGAAYGVHYVKSKVMSRVAMYTGHSSGDVVQVAQGNACGLLSAADVEHALGVSIERTSEMMEGSEPGCAYYTNPTAFAHLREVAIEQAKRDSETASKDTSMDKSDNPLALLKHTKEMEGIVKTFAISGGEKDGKVFGFTIDRKFGRENWSTLRGTLSIVPGFDDVAGVGDAAMVGSFGHTLLILKGDSIIHLDMEFVPEAQKRGAQLGRTIVAHM